MFADINRYMKGTIFIALLSVALYGCGDIGGGGSCGGSGDSGLCLVVESIEPTYNGSPTSSVDMFMSWCEVGEDEWDIEFFAAHPAEVKLRADTVPGVDAAIASPWIQIYRYTVTFNLISGAGTGPLLPSANYDMSKNILADGSYTFTADMVTMGMKTDLVMDNWIDGTWGFPMYTVTYTFFGEDAFGRDVSATAFETLTLGAFNNCDEAA